MKPIDKNSPTIKTKAKPKRRATTKKSRRFVSSKNSTAKKTVKANLAIAQKNPRLKNNLDKQKQRKVQSKSPLWLAIYAITITVGLSTILGTLVSVVSSFQASTTPSPTRVTVSTDSPNKVKLDSLFAITSLGKEITTLKADLQQLAEQYPDLKPEIFLVDLDTKGFVSIEGEKTIASASTIKLPILVAFLQDVERGKISLEEQLTITQDTIAEGSGNMQYEEPGTEYSAWETATKMMTISDNTATNMLIQRLGGINELNERFSTMGLKATRLSNPLPDLTGKNITTPEDLGNLLIKIDSGQLISLRSRDRLLHIMRNTARNTLLPENLPSEAIVAHKTGDIKSVLGDVGIIDMPTGKRYVASILVKRPDNSPQAKEFIQKASSVAYQYFEQPQGNSFTLDEEQE